MINFKKQIANLLATVTNLEINEVERYIEMPPEEEMGDYAFPCFRLAKEWKKAPTVIAQDLKEELTKQMQSISPEESILEKVEVVGGYLNFYIHRPLLIQTTVQELDEQKEAFGKANIGQGKTIIVEYSSPNIAKPFHIGHLRNTLIGHTLYNMYQFLGYHTVGINHLGDYGTQFGKMIEGYQLWGKEYHLDENPIEELTKIYVRINDLCKQDETVLEACRNNFKKLEEGDPACVEIWNRFKELSLKEFNRIYAILGVKFDSYHGEAFYSDKMDEVVHLLEKSGKLITSEGAKVVNLEDQKMGVCMIKKSNGSTTYATRDLAAILYRTRTYDFDKCLYVVAYEQTLHFKQIFEVAKLLGIEKKYMQGLKHIPYGMVHLKTGKMSTREGNVIKVNDLLEEAVRRVEKLIDEKNPTMENKEANAQKIGIGAITFANISTTLIKDQVFDWDTILNFNGETGPYIQYTYVRTKSILQNLEVIPTGNEVDIQELNSKEGYKVIKQIYHFQNTVIEATDKNEPSILARYLIDLAKAYTSFYNEYKIMSENTKERDARVYLTYITGLVLKIGMKLLGIEMPDKM